MEVTGSSHWTEREPEQGSDSSPEPFRFRA